MSIHDSLKRMGFNYGLEDDGVVLDEPTSEPENLDETTELESELIEAQERQEELDNYERDAETAVDALEAYALTILNAQIALEEHGGLDKYAARQYNITKTFIHRTMGMPVYNVKTIDVPSMEDFATRKEITRVSLEDDKDGFSKWWENIKTFFKNAITKSVDAIVGLFSAVKAVENRALQINKECQSSDAKFEGKMTKDQQKKYGKRFSIVSGEEDIKVSDFNSIGIVFSNGIKFGTISVPKMTKILNDRKNINFGEGGKGEDQTFSDQTWKDLEKAPEGGDTGLDPKILEEIRKKESAKSEDGKHTFALLQKTFDGHCLYATRTLDKEKEDKQVIDKGQLTGSQSISFKFEQIFNKSEDDKRLFEYENLTADICKKFVKDIAGYATKMRTVQNNIKNFTKAFDDFMKAVDTKTRGIGEAIIGTFKRFVNWIKGFFSASNGLNKWFKYTLASMRDALNIVSIRLSSAKGDDKDDDKDKDKDKKEENKPAENSTATSVTPAATS